MSEQTEWEKWEEYRAKCAVVYDAKKSPYDSLVDWFDQWATEARPMKSTYTFSGHTDRYRRFDRDAVHVGDTESGKAVFAWRDGLWVIEERSGASVFYVARRVSASDISKARDTLAARNALADLCDVLTN